MTGSKKMHRKIAKEDNCICGGKMIFLFGDFICVEKIQRELINTGYSLFKKT